MCFPPVRLGFCLLALYGAGVTGCILGLSWPAPVAGYVAFRDMPAGTRLADELLVAPQQLAVEDRLRLLFARKALLGRYLTVDLHKGEAISQRDTADWPHGAEGGFPVELSAQPKWLEWNAGACVRATPPAAQGKKPDPGKDATVAEVVPDGKRGWTALLMFNPGDSWDHDSGTPTLNLLALPTLTGCGAKKS